MKDSTRSSNETEKQGAVAGICTSLDGVLYYADPIPEGCRVRPGDKLVFLAPPHYKEYEYQDFSKIQNRVVTIQSVSTNLGLAVREHYNGSYQHRRYFHEIIYPEVDLSGFDDVFV